MSSPLVVEVVRNGFVESRHRGHVVALSADGSLLLTAGDVDAPMLSRSSLKPLQAAAMLDAGWEPDDNEQVALATASHSGEDVHVAVVRRILSAAGLDPTALQNIPALPLNTDGSAPEHAPQEAGNITGVLWRTRNQTPDIDFDYRRMKIKLDSRGTAKLSGTIRINSTVFCRSPLESLMPRMFGT